MKTEIRRFYGAIGTFSRGKGDRSLDPDSTNFFILVALLAA